MILTPLNIQIAIIKAFYALAKKSIKYYTGLALGKNNICLSKEARLLRSYIDILRNFEIVGSVDACHCCIDGEYTVMVDETPSGQVQFLCDGSGYLYPNGTIITYAYDSVNKKLIWDVYGELLIFTNVTFLSDCSFTGINIESFFEFTKNTPCTPTVVTETCLTNNQVLKIIQHINKLVR